MSGRSRTVGRTVGRFALGILLFWAFTPIIIILGFLGWATFAASGVWQVVFGLCTFLMLLAIGRWIRSLLKRRARAGAESMERASAAASPLSSSFGGIEAQV